MGRAARLKRERRSPAAPDVRLVNPASAHLAEFIRTNAVMCREVVRRDSAKGKHLVLCGAGPSLAENAAEHCASGDQVWACNSALDWLLANGHRVTHGFTVNQLDAMLWPESPNVEYLMASSAIPSLAARLLLARRTVTWFHNYVEFPDQDQLYATLYPSTVCAGSGLSAVTRALDVASYMGFDQVTVLGADCALRGDVMHVNGKTAVQSGCSDVMMSGPIDGRIWTAQPDLWITASWLVRMARASNGRIRLVGDTLPVALLDKPDSFLQRLPQMVDSRGKVVPIPF